LKPCPLVRFSLSTLLSNSQFPVLYMCVCALLTPFVLFAHPSCSKHATPLEDTRSDPKHSTDEPASKSDPKSQKKGVSYVAERVIGNGSFGVVFLARSLQSGERVAIKKVLQDRRYKVCFAFLPLFVSVIATIA
jgi:hypothetical protein